MKKTFEIAESKVLLIEANSSLRMVLSTAISEIGVRNLSSCADLSAAMEVLEVERFDWVITQPAVQGDPVTGMHLLKLCCEVPALRDTRVSFIVDPEQSILPEAYEMGLMSHMPSCQNLLDAQKHFGAFFQRLESCEFDPILCAATYIRELLSDQAHYQNRINFERILLTLYPGKIDLLTHLSEALMKSGALPEATSVVQQAMALGSKHPQIEQFAQELGVAPTLARGESHAPVNVLGLGRCIVIDPDPVACDQIENILSSLGVSEVLKFTDSREAVAELEKKDGVDLVVMEWRQTQIPGPVLIQQIRLLGYVETQVVVASSLVKPSDLPLLREMGVSNIAKKPVFRDDAIQTLIWTIQEARTPHTAQALERKVRTLLASKRPAEAEKEFADYVKAHGSVTPSSRLLMIQAEMTYSGGDYERAQELASRSLKEGGDGTMLFNLLGKCYMQQLDFQSALKCFNSAHKTSPINIERLCSIAETHSELGNHVEAAAALQHAHHLEPSSVVVKQSDVTCSLVRGDTSRARTIMSQLESIDSVTSFMNNRAVALAKNGDLEGGIALYRKAIKALPPERTEFKATILYNLSLAYVKSGDIDEALIPLNLLLGTSPGTKVERKAQSLRYRIEESLRTGAPVSLLRPAHELNSSKGDSRGPKSSADDQGLLNTEAILDVNIGDLCCYRIFISPYPKSALVRDLLSNPPRFGRGEAISCNEGLGVERILKAG